MAARGGLATIVIAVVTAAVSLAILATDNLSGMAIAGGFIPLRFDGGTVPADHYFAVPAWLTPLTATRLPYPTWMSRTLSKSLTLPPRFRDRPARPWD